MSLRYLSLIIQSYDRRKHYVSFLLSSSNTTRDLGLLPPFGPNGMTAVCLYLLANGARLSPAESSHCKSWFDWYAGESQEIFGALHCNPCSRLLAAVNICRLSCRPASGLRKKHIVGA